MGFLHLLQSFRTPWLSSIMEIVTYFGDEIAFLGIALFVFWCLSKWDGYYLLTVGFLGIALNQCLKITCRIPRPWVRDPSLTVVGNAQEAATGYSFPSGHTQNVTGTLGVVAATHKQRWLRIACIALILLTAFSRMYLGVHTPADVLTSLAIGTVLVIALRPLMRWIGQDGKRLMGLLLVMMGLSLLFLGYVYLFPFPADIDAANLASARENAWTMIGAVGGMCLSCAIDFKWLHFRTEAVWWAQILKLVLGLALVLAVKEGLKPLMVLLFGQLPFSRAIRYFFCVIMAAVLWPLSFQWFGRLGKRQFPGKSGL